jgi:site-specific recombinase XerD
LTGLRFNSLSKAQLEAWIAARRKAGMSPCGINIYIRAMNSFSAWLKEEGHGEQIVLKQLKAPQKAVTVLAIIIGRRVLDPGVGCSRAEQSFESMTAGAASTH